MNQGKMIAESSRDRVWAGKHQLRGETGRLERGERAEVTLGSEFEGKSGFPSASPSAP